jgi:hypothetical protein
MTTLPPSLASNDVRRSSRVAKSKSPGERGFAVEHEIVDYLPRLGKANSISNRVSP